MEHFDLVEKLVSTFGVSYEQAKAALESCDWDAVDAAVLIERQKKKSAEEEDILFDSKDESMEEVSAVEKEIPTETREQAGTQSEPESQRRAAVGADDFRKFREEAQQKGSGIVSWVMTFLTQNRLVVKKPEGQIFLDLPIWLVAVLLIAAFWPVLVILGIVFVMGYRFSFEGPQLGKDAVKKVVNSVENAGENILHDVKKGMAQPADHVQHPQEGTQPENNTSNRE